MVYPATELPVYVYLAPDGVPTADPGSWAWEDVSDEVRLGPGIVIEQGRGNWGDTVDSGPCRLTFDNTAGHYTPSNPLGRWYGSLGKNTPLKVTIRRIEDAFGRTVSNGWGTADSGQAWSTSGGSASDYSVGSGAGTISLGATGTVRATVAASSLVDVDMVATLRLGVVPTGAGIAGGLMARRVDSSNYYYADLLWGTADTVQVRVEKIIAGTTTNLATSSAVAGLTSSSSIRLRVVVDGDTIKARAWSAAGSEPTTWHAEVTDTALTAAGSLGVRTRLNAGNTNTLPVTITCDDIAVEVVRFGGWVPSWPPRWDLSGNNATVPITAYGVLYRTQPGQAKPPERSPLYRTIEATGPAGYWPCEDGELAGQFGSALPGDAPLLVSGTISISSPEDYGLGTASLPRFGTSALVDLGDGGILTAALSAAATTATATRWTAHCVFRIASMSGASGSVTIMRVHTPGGTYARWDLVYAATSRTQVIAYTAAGAATTVIDDASIVTSFTEFAFSIEQSGGNITVELYEDSNDVYATASIAGTVAGVTRVTANATGATTADPFPFGHLAVWAAAAPQIDIEGEADTYGYPLLPARYAHAREAAHLRLARLAAEDDVDIYMPTVDDEALTTRMSWQEPGTPIALWRECEASDGGVLYERPHSLGYQPRAARYNQTAALALDFDAGQVAEAPQPSDDDQQYRNRVKVTRRDGSSAIVQTDTFDDELTYDAEFELSLLADTQTANEAAWKLWLYTQDVFRWPRMEIDLAAAPELIDAWLCCRIGSRVTAANPPDQVIAEVVDTLIEGYVEVLGGESHKTWDVDLNLSPNRPWTIAEVDGTPRVAAGASTLASSVTTTGLSLSIASSDGTLWTTDAADFPLDVSLKPSGAPGRGERVTLSAISGTSSPQTATVSARSVNGVIKAWDAGTVVQVWDVAIVGH